MIRMGGMSIFLTSDFRQGFVKDTLNGYEQQIVVTSELGYAMWRVGRS
jgi:hypothetical protein